MDNITVNKESMLWFFERMHGRLPQSAEEFTEFCKPPKHEPKQCEHCENTASVGYYLCPSCESHDAYFNEQ